MISLGLDVGSNSVGSAWVDTETGEFRLGASVFPAGVDETDAARGAPVNQKRRQARSARRSVARKAARKRRLRALLTEKGLLPTEKAELKALFDGNAWHLRRDALKRELTPYEFGRVLVHLNQRRGALGVGDEAAEGDEGKVKKAIDQMEAKLDGRTIGQFMADLMDSRKVMIKDGEASYQEPVRNLRSSYEFHAKRSWVRDEFVQIWEKQREYGGELSAMLTEELRKQLDDPTEDRTWREGGVMFGQRRTYWRASTLGRCDLEPTDHRCPIHDMYAQRYRLIETVNNIRISERGKKGERCLTEEERGKLIEVLSRQKSASVATVRSALGIDKRSLAKQEIPADHYSLNLEKDEEREINTDGFSREIIHGVFGEDRWEALDGGVKESVNKTLLRLDVAVDGDEQKLRNAGAQWWGLDADGVEKLVEAWKGRGRTDKRLNLSRRAICNLLGYMERFDGSSGRWPTQIEAGQMFAEDSENGATLLQRVRYAHTITPGLKDQLLRELGGDETELRELLLCRGTTKGDRHYLRKHGVPLPPAPELANPVVRKAIHEVRRHVIAHIERAGCRPDRIVIELARQAKQSEKVRNAILDRNRSREGVRKKIVDEHDLGSKSPNQQRAAQERVILCRQQHGVCAYTGKTITEHQAVQGDDLEVDHIIPYSRSGDNSLNNRVLCYKEANQEKGNKTVLEWWGDSFEDRIRPLAFMNGFKPTKEDYFSKKDYARKWENLTREVRPEDEWRNSQLTDTAYASKQVMSYLRDSLFDGVREEGRGVYMTNGRYTAQLRRDWELLDESEPKDRNDHRHHAVDAFVAAWTDPHELLPQLAKQAEAQEEHRQRTGHWCKPLPLPPPGPYKDVEKFRGEAMDAVRELVVSHRAVKRKLVGRFHEETLFGPVIGDDQSFTSRKSVEDLTPNHLRLPVEETTKEAVERLSKRYVRRGLDEKEAKKRAREVVKGTGYRARMIDPTPGKSGIVRDQSLRRQLRACVDEGLKKLKIKRDADTFTQGDAKKLASEGLFCMASGVPIKRVVLLRAMKDPVVMRRRVWDPESGEMKPDKDPRTMRVYVGGNNHHIEIREDSGGKWKGEVVPAFDAARRVRMEKVPAVDRSDKDGRRFVMSLAEGEMVHMIAPKTEKADYYVVVKLDKPQTVHFVRHSDARRATAAEKKDVRESVAVSATDLRSCGVEPGEAPYKVVVDPLGCIRRVND